MSEEKEPIKPILYTVKQAAAYLGVSESSIRLWKNQGRLGHVDLGRKQVFLKQDLDDFVQRNWHPAREGYILPAKIRIPKKIGIKPPVPQKRGRKMRVRKPKGEGPQGPSLRGPTALHAKPLRPRSPGVRREGPGFFGTRPSARSRLLRIWRAAHS